MNTNQHSKTTIIAKIISIYLALILTACSVTPVSTPSPSTPPATEAIPTSTEIPIELEGKVFSTTEDLPEEITCNSKTLQYYFIIVIDSLKV